MPSNRRNDMIPTYSQLVAKRAATMMTSRELAAIADKRHDNVMRVCRDLRDSGVCPQIEETPYIEASNGQTYTECQLNQRDSYVAMARLSPEFTARLVDRWQELEARNTPVALPALPKTFAEALRALADKSEESERQAAALALAAPKVEFVDRYVTADTGAKGFRQVCKLLKANESRFREFLAEERIMYRLNGDLIAYQNHIDAGRFECKTGEANGHAFSRCLFTPKGVEWVAGEWAKRQIRDADLFA